MAIIMVVYPTLSFNSGICGMYQKQKGNILARPKIFLVTLSVCLIAIARQVGLVSNLSVILCILSVLSTKYETGATTRSWSWAFFFFFFEPPLQNPSFAPLVPELRRYNRYFLLAWICTWPGRLCCCVAFRTVWITISLLSFDCLANVSNLT